MTTPLKMVIPAFLTLLPLAAQDIKLPVNLDRLAAKAADVVDVTMDGALLQLAAKFLSDKDPDEARIKRLVSGLKGVYVKSLKFDGSGEYKQSDVDDLRAQLRPPAWVKVVGVRNRRDGDNADLFLKSEGGQITGLAIIVTNPRELTIVHIAGPIHPEDVRDLGGHFGIPRLDGLGRKGEAKEEER